LSSTKGTVGPVRRSIYSAHERIVIEQGRDWLDYVTAFRTLAAALAAAGAALIALFAEEST
jgi:hypothetical protein